MYIHSIVFKNSLNVKVISQYCSIVPFQMDLNKFCGNVLLQFTKDVSGDFLEGKVLKCLEAKFAESAELLTSPCRSKHNNFFCSFWVLKLLRRDEFSDEVKEKMTIFVLLGTTIIRAALTHRQGRQLPRSPDF